MPKVSIIMAVNNGAAFIRQAIESVLAQSFRDWELIVVDDGSMDETAQIVSEFGTRVVMLRQEQQGPSASRNHGLQVATGTYVAFLDADDLWHRDFLTDTVKQLNQQEDSIVGVCVGWTYVNKDGSALGDQRSMRHASLTVTDFLLANPFPIHAALLRRATLVAHGGFDARLSGMEDWDLWLRLTAAGGRFAPINQCLAYYRLHGTTNSRNADTMRAGRLRAFGKLFARQDIPAAIRALSPVAVARVLIQSSAQFFASQCTTEALRDFCEAVREYPDVLRDDETYYAVICADQPIAYKGTGQMLDLAAGESRVLDVLSRAMDGLPRSHAAWRARPFACAYLVLARLAYALGSMATVRRYLRLAAQHDAVLVGRPENVLLFCKSWLTPDALARLKHIKSHFVRPVHSRPLSPAGPFVRQQRHD